MDPFPYASSVGQKRKEGREVWREEEEGGEEEKEKIEKMEEREREKKEKKRRRRRRRCRRKQYVRQPSPLLHSIMHNKLLTGTKFFSLNLFARKVTLFKQATRSYLQNGRLVFKGAD